MCHGVTAAVVGECLDDDTGIGVVGTDLEYGGPAHPSQGFEDHLAVLFQESADLIGTAGDECWRRALGKKGGKNLLVGIAQALWFVDHQ